MERAPGAVRAPAPRVVPAAAPPSRPRIQILPAPAERGATHGAHPAASHAALGTIAFPGARGDGDDARAHASSPLRRGFPMLEFGIALAIVALLTLLASYEYRKAVMRARAATTAADLVVMRDGLLRYYSDCRTFPAWDGRAGDPGLLHRPAEVALTWGGPYLLEWPSSTPLGGRYSYHYPSPYGVGGAPVLEAEGLELAEALALAKALGAGVMLEMQPTRPERREPARWTVRLDLAHRIGSGAASASGPR